jgi:hypothetical protein
MSLPFIAAIARMGHAAQRVAWVQVFNHSTYMQMAIQLYRLCGWDTGRALMDSLQVKVICMYAIQATLTKPQAHSSECLTSTGTITGFK